MEIRYSLTSFLINEVEFESPRVRQKLQYIHIMYILYTMTNVTIRVTYKWTY